MSDRLESELVENVRSVLRLRAEAEEKTEYLNERVDIRLVGPGNGPFIARKRDFEIVVDEPAIRAGQDTAPNPLAFFVTGAATCYLSHLMMLAIDAELTITKLTATARGRFNRRAVGGHLVRAVYDIRIDSPDDPRAVAVVAERAGLMCYAHNTLAKAGVEVHTNVHVNGTRAAALRADTAHLPGARGSATPP